MSIEAHDFDEAEDNILSLKEGQFASRWRASRR
jgi:hypothetical protein